MPDQIVVQPEVAKPEITAGTQPEILPIAEQIPVSPTPPPTIQPEPSSAPDPGSSVPIQDDVVVPKEEIADLTDSGVEPVDDNWVGKVREVIREDKDQPFKEEEDAEALNDAYMKDRFNVKIDEEGK